MLSRPHQPPNGIVLNPHVFNGRFVWKEDHRWAQHEVCNLVCRRLTADSHIVFDDGHQKGLGDFLFDLDVVEPVVVDLLPSKEVNGKNFSRSFQSGVTPKVLTSRKPRSFLAFAFGFDPQTLSIQPPHPFTFAANEGSLPTRPFCTHATCSVLAIFSIS